MAVLALDGWGRGKPHVQGHRGGTQGGMGRSPHPGALGTMSPSLDALPFCSPIFKWGVHCSQPPGRSTNPPRVPSLLRHLLPAGA